MPVALTYPGVYVEEIPSGVRSITGVATSITAVVGRTRRGPTDEDGPVVVNSYPDFVRTFGGLWAASPTTYAVRDFFANGGAQAVIVRIYKPKAAEKTRAVLKLAPATGAGNFELVARYPGKWGNQLRARVDYKTRPTEPGEAANSLFNLYVRDGGTGQVEEFRNLSIETGHKRRADKVLNSESTLVKAPAAPPSTTVLPDDHPDPKPGTSVLWDDTTSTKVAAGDEATDGDIPAQPDYSGGTTQVDKRGIYALDHADLFNLLCIPPYSSDVDGTLTDIGKTLIADAATYCEKRRAMLIVDPPWKTRSDAATKLGTDIGSTSKNAALFFPRLIQPNPERDNRLEEVAPCGAVAGVIARTDAQRGVWKAPAGLDASLVGAPGLQVPLTDAENGELNPLGINCLRVMPAAGAVVWGARTLRGDDRLASEWKYLPVRRTALYLEESLYRGTQWVVFEPNDEPLWAQIRLNVGAFLHNLFVQGAFQGTTPRQAYFVKCDKETTTQTHINAGVVNIVVGFAPLRPAEFVVIQLQQIAGQIAV